MSPTQSPAGFKELPHTADVALHVWGPDPESLFTQAALGLNTIAGVRLGGERLARQLTLHGVDLASLLVAFLSELVFLQENERLAFDEFELQVTTPDLRGTLAGARIRSLDKPIKAVTFHNLMIHTTERGLEVEVVFDV